MKLKQLILGSNGMAEDIINKDKQERPHMYTMEGREGIVQQINDFIENKPNLAPEPETPLESFGSFSEM